MPPPAPGSAAGDADESATTEFFERSLLPAVTIDHREMAILDVNRAALEFIGLPRSAIIGRAGRDFLRDPSPDLVLRVRALRGDTTVAVRTVTTAYGDRTVQLHMAPSEIPGTTYVQLVDLTDLVDAARRAEAQAEALDRKAAALETLAAQLAHDLRGPMTAISGFAQLLLEQGGQLDDDERSEMLRRIKRSTIALADMTSTLVSEAVVSEPASGSSHEVADLFDAVAAVTDTEMHAAGGTLRTTTNVSTLPVPISAIRQALVNLVSNSIRYRHPERELLVEIDVRASSGSVEIVVRDNGTGLPDDPAPLFRAGRRGANSADVPGSGLGLAFVAAALTALGGTAEARARAEGAEFHLTIPAPNPADAAAVAPYVVGGSTSTGLTAPGLMRIIDDSPVATVVIDLAVRRILHANTACKDLFDLDGDGGVGQSAASFLTDPAVGDALRADAIADPGTCHTARTEIETAHGPRPVVIWLAGVQNTPLAVAQIVELSQLDGSAAEDGAPAPR